MTKFEVWYDDEQDEPDVIESSGELDAILDRLIAAGGDAPAPSMVQLAVADDPHAHLIVNAGLGNTRGVISAIGSDGGLSLGDPRRDGTVVYDYMSNAREYPASAEIPIEQVRAALREYVSSGGQRPASVRLESDAERLHRTT